MIDLIIKIYQEKCWCDFDYNAAIKFLEEACGIIYNDETREIFDGLLTGEYYYKGDSFVKSPNPDSLNYKELFQVRLDSLKRDYLSIDSARQNIYKFRTQSEYDTFSYNDLCEYVKTGNLNSDIISNIRYMYKFNLANIETVNKLIVINDEFNLCEMDELQELLMEINKCNDLLFSEDFESTLPKLTEFIKRERELNEIGHLDPTNELCDAGYIAPNGDYYGLNGDVGNLLHIKIANILEQSHVITCDEMPEVYLEQHGWIKQHSLEINYWTSKTKINQLQKDKIVELFDGKEDKIYINSNPFNLSTFKNISVEELEFVINEL